MKISTLMYLLAHPSKILLAAGRNGYFHWMADDVYLSKAFKSETGYDLNLREPKTYNEKLQWIKINDRRSEYTLFADKYKVREFVAQKLGKQYLIPLIGVYADEKQIPWDRLPERFVIKCSHGSGMNIVCKNREGLDIEQARRSLHSWMKKNQYWGGREWCYKNITPMIVCEQFISDDNSSTPDDYKFMCFNGQPKLIQLHHDRFGEHTLTYYTPDWQKADIKRIDEADSNEAAPRPSNLSTMLDIARKLSQGLYYARIDLYSVKEKIYFGEITLYPTGGFSTFSRFQDDQILGSWLHLPCDDWRE